MIENYYTGTPDHQLKPRQYESTVAPVSLTLEKNSVLIIRCNQQYDLSALNIIREQMQKAFPNNTVLVTYDDIDFLTIADKTYKPERPLAEEPYDAYY